MIKHSKEFKQEAVRIALTSGLSRERVASDLGVGKSTLGKCIGRYRPTNLISAPQADLARENERLRLENRVLQDEREGLKKATQFVASQRPLGSPLCTVSGTIGQWSC
jgi:transposase